MAELPVYVSDEDEEECTSVNRDKIALVKVSLGGYEFDASREHINAVGGDVSEEDAVSFGERMVAGEFESLQTLHLVREFEFGTCCCAYLAMLSRCEGMLELTRGLQGGNHVGDAGACGLGLGLKVNSSLLELNLVRDFMIYDGFLMCFDHVF